ncbi:MAG: SDR family NAD(P)-dependent oxidoreductase [Myxococcales bacterium]|nr:SDR family NAD(P)-dependent oxidoreductase [Myxococcales bacterium]
MQDFEGRVAVVTGGASGIGRALAEAFVELGMKVVLADVEEALLENTAGALAAAGGDVIGVRTDVAKASDLKALAEKTLERYGAVHVLCNNAGVFCGGRTWDAPIEDYDWLLGVNVYGVLHGIQAFVPLMLAQGGEGHIVNTASMAGVTALPFVSAYHMSKHAVMALSECLYKELAAEHSSIGVSVLCPEMINTRIGTSERNRPSDPSRDPERQSSPIKDLIEKSTVAAAAGGIPPKVIADRVVDAIRAERFYILSDDTWRDLGNTRLEDIRLGRNPTLALPEG